MTLLGRMRTDVVALDALEALAGRGDRGMDRSRCRCFSEVARGMCAQDGDHFLRDAKERADLMASLAATRDGLGRD